MSDSTICECGKRMSDTNWHTHPKPLPDKKEEPKPAGDWRDEWDKTFGWTLIGRNETALYLTTTWTMMTDFISRVESSALSKGREQGIREALGVVPEMPRYPDDAYLYHRDQWNGGNNAARQAILNLLPKE
jgi:hypothetical protein